MNKEELKQCIQIYSKIEYALIERRENIGVRRNGINKNITLYPWMYRLPDIIRTIEVNETNQLITIIIEKNLRNGIKDKIVMRDIPISESTYYRWKSQLIDKVFNLLILHGEVTLEEILADSIK